MRAGRTTRDATWHDVHRRGAGATGVVTWVVMRGTGGVWRVRDEAGTVREASLRGRLKQDEALKLAVGDEVELEPDERGGGAWAIAAIHPRRSRLARRAPGGAQGERVVAANVDQVVVVFAAAQPDPHPRMLDRFLVIAAANDVPARIVLNKVDLAPAGLRERFAAYAGMGYALHTTSTLTGDGLAELHDALRGRVSALTGPSGVGKSSLLNAIYPGLGLRVGEISRSVNKGRHTTVGADMHPIPEGGYVVDTPGLREVGVWNIPAEALDACFIEFRPLLGRCRFRDCRHRAEPGCAVCQAVEAGTVTRERYESYRKLLEELEQSERPW